MKSNKICCWPKLLNPHLAQILLLDKTWITNLSQLINSYYHFAAMLHADKWSVSNANFSALFLNRVKWENQTWKLVLMDDVFWTLIMEPCATFIKASCFHLLWLNKHFHVSTVADNQVPRRPCWPAICIDFIPIFPYSNSVFYCITIQLLWCKY